MIVYKDILPKLISAGYTTTRIRKERILSECILTKLRNNEPVGLTIIDKLCRLLSCQPGDLMEYIDEAAK